MIIVTCHLVIQCTVIATSEPPNFGELNALYYQGICLPEMAYFVLKYYHDYDYGLAIWHGLPLVMAASAILHLIKLIFFQGIPLPRNTHFVVMA